MADSKNSSAAFRLFRRWANDRNAIRDGCKTRQLSIQVCGAAALETTQIEAIEEVYWEDLMPECLWKFRVKDLGPLTIAIDACGGNLYAEVKDGKARRQNLLGRLSRPEAKS